MQRLFDDAQLEWWANQISAFISTKGHTQQAWESVRSHESYSKQEIEKRPANSEEAKAISEVALLALKVLNSCESLDEYSQTKEPILQNAKEKIERLLPYCSGWATMYAPLDEALVHFEIRFREKHCEENIMEEKIIVIKPDDTIELADYDGYESLSKTVNGMITCFHRLDLPVDPVEINPSVSGPTKLNVDLYCNDEFLIDDSKEFDKINAVAFLMSNQEIRGNVAMVVDAGGGENRGFEYKDYTNDQEGVRNGFRECRNQVVSTTLTTEGGGGAMDYCECAAAMKSVWEFIHLHERALKGLHEKYDNNKSEPVIEVTSWDSNGKVHKSSDRDERS